MEFVLADTHFENATRMKGDVDGYIARSAAFAQPILSYLREAIHEAAPGVVEEMKWSRPFFVYQGVILANTSAFKRHCSFGLWGAQVEQALRSDGIADGGGMGSMGKITSLEDLPPRKKLLAYIRTAAKTIEDGERTKAWSRPKVAKPTTEVPAELAAALKKNKAAMSIFESKGVGWRREYCEWIADAKRPETREKRVATAIDWIIEGKTRNWKYKTSG